MISYIMIALNVVVFLLVQQNPHLMQKGMLIPYRMVRQGSWYELLSSGFLHGGWTHLLFNMITLLFFGPVLERSIGEVHFFILYSSGLLFSSLPSLFKHKNNPNYATIGASGAVAEYLERGIEAIHIGDNPSTDFYTSKLYPNLRVKKININ